jgi:hypothetical protein
LYFENVHRKFTCGHTTHFFYGSSGQIESATRNKISGIIQPISEIEPEVMRIQQSEIKISPLTCLSIRSLMPSVKKYRAVNHAQLITHSLSRYNLSYFPIKVVGKYTCQLKLFIMTSGSSRLSPKVFLWTSDPFFSILVLKNK